MADQYPWVDNCCVSGVAPCNTDVLNDCLMHLKYNNKSGGGLELCDIGTALFIDETKGLRRRLNGSIMDITSNYQAFLTRLKEITTLYPSLVCTETEWQTIKTMSKLGQCGKFVYNYDTDGTTITSIRLPLVININGLVDMSNAGMIKDESLPNIKGTTACNTFKQNGTTTGAFYVTDRGSGTYSSAAIVGCADFDASLSSSTYQDNAPVQQEAIQYPYFIQIATGQETENNIKDTLELNNPFTFGMNIYFKGEMENISWLKSNGQQNLKALYPDFYNWVLTNANAGKDGFKLSTASDITDYDFVVNTTNETFRLPLKNGQEGVFASGVKGNGFGIHLTNGSQQGDLVGLGGSTNIAYNTDGVNASIGTSYTTGTRSLFDNLKTIGVTTDSSKSGMVVDTTVPAGYNLYYYVGVVIKNEGLINAGRIGEILPTKLDASKVKAYIVETYQNGNSWYRLWSDNWCEQGGLQSYQGPPYGLQTVTLLKPYIDTNYTVTANIVFDTAWFTDTSIGPHHASTTDAIGNIANRTKSSFDIQRLSSHFWKAEGYIA